MNLYFTSKYNGINKAGEQATKIQISQNLLQNRQESEKSELSFELKLGSIRILN